VREITLPSLYSLANEALPPITACKIGDYQMVRFNNSLGEAATITAFDYAMQEIPRDATLVLDFRDTPSGGNTTVARAIIGWFVTEARGYQMHNVPKEKRQTGIARQWIEQVLPRDHKYHPTLPVVLVGRWTGSMGEGVAIGFAAIGAEVQGTRMAGLNGSVEDLRLGETDLHIKLPTEQLRDISRNPRESFAPQPIGDDRLISASC
jgi:hypothetical protein